jgi:hypothetical protein
MKTTMKIAGAAALMLATSAFAFADTALDSEDAESITLMREEEKLARDVYLALYELWGVPVFDRIADSEQRHMDAVLTLIDAYEMEDPAGSPGVFQNEDLQGLYDTLVARGSESLVEALRVGALIEEVDIADLDHALVAGVPDDVAVVYDNLLNGSESHLRAFVSQIERQGEEYAPEILSQEQYDAISSEESAQRGRAAGRTGHEEGGRRIVGRDR